MTENLWLAAVGLIGAGSVGALVRDLIGRVWPSRADDAEIKVAEVTADATAAGAWQSLYQELKQRVDGLTIEVAELKESLTEADRRVQIQASLLRSVCRWALLLRDELLKVDGHVPPMPPDVEAALTTLEP